MPSIVALILIVKITSPVDRDYLTKGSFILVLFFSF